MLRKLLLTGWMSILFASVVLAQTGSISGTVTDAESGETVPGANVLLVETDRGASTNADGEYRISNIPVGTYTLRISFVGYRTYEERVQIQSATELTKNVELESGSIGLDEVVVTGYGVESKREVTGSISNVSAQDLQDIPLQNTDALLQGRASGVQIATTSGNPGGGFQVRVRGQGSINAGSDPLYIVDGVQMSFSNSTEMNDASPLNAIKGSDIESIEVLKDASAAAIYGAQASNGVVLITTKQGRQGDTQINVSYERGIRAPIAKYDVMNAEQWIDYHVESWGESSTRSIISDIYGYPEDVDFSTLPTFDWQDFIYRTGSAQNINFSASGGTEQTQFFISGGWEATEGHVKQVDFERFNFRTNFDHQFTDKLFSSFKVSLSNQDMPGVCQDGFFVNCPFYQSIEEAPISTPYLPVGETSLGGEYNPFTEQGGNNNPAVVLFEEDRQTKITHIVGSIDPNYNIKPWLTLTGHLGIDWRQSRETDYESPLADPSNDGSVNRRFGTVSNFNTNLRLNAARTFREYHNVSGLIGAEYRRELEDEVEATSIGIGNPFFKVIDAAAEPSFNQGFNTEFRIAGYFSQMKYNYDSRYFVTLTGRYDGSSRFGSEKRWGFFPSASVGWNMAEENFFNIDVFDDLKLRASYGVTGNASINNFASRGLYSAAGSYKGTTGLTPNQLANNRLTWEESREINLGLDYSLFNGRLSGSIEAYKRNNTDLLLDRPLPNDSGFGSITENIGEVENKGLEFELSSVNIDRGDFFWNTRFNISVQQNEVLSLTEGVDILDPDDDDPIAVGHSLQAFWMPRWAGVNPADGRPMWYDKDGNITYFPSQEDNVFLDGGEEDVIGGFGNRFEYKGLSLDIFFQFSFGQTAQPQTEFSWLPPVFEGVLAAVDNRWREPGDVAPYPEAKTFGTGYFESASWQSINSSNSLYDASYIRLKNVRLGYSLPAKLIDRLNIRGIRVYATGVNLMTWSNYLGVDPEVTGNEESQSFPTGLQVNGGIELQF